MSPVDLLDFGWAPGALLLAGLGLGLAYFAAMRRSVERHVEARPWLGTLALTLGRLGAAAALFVVAAQLGAAALLAAFLGFLGARAVALRAR
jgi:hypothetical protein